MAYNRNTSSSERGTMIAIGIVGLIIGIMAMVWATNISAPAHNGTMPVDQNAPVMCGGQQMQPGQTCEVSYSNRTSSGSFDNSYDQQRVYSQKKNAENTSTCIGGFGLVCALFSLVILLKGMRGR